MNAADLLEKLQTLELLTGNRYPRLKPIHDDIMRELEDYAEKVKKRAQDSEEDANAEEDEEAKPSPKPAAPLRKV